MKNESKKNLILNRYLNQQSTHFTLKNNVVSSSIEFEKTFCSNLRFNKESFCKKNYVVNDDI